MEKEYVMSQRDQQRQELRSQASSLAAQNVPQQPKKILASLQNASWIRTTDQSLSQIRNRPIRPQQAQPLSNWRPFIGPDDAFPAALFQADSFGVVARIRAATRWDAAAAADFEARVCQRLKPTYQLLRDAVQTPADYAHLVTLFDANNDQARLFLHAATALNPNSEGGQVLQCIGAAIEDFLTGNNDFEVIDDFDVNDDDDDFVDINAPEDDVSTVSRIAKEDEKLVQFVAQLYALFVRQIVDDFVEEKIWFPSVKTPAIFFGDNDNPNIFSPVVLNEKHFLPAGLRFASKLRPILHKYAFDDVVNPVFQLLVHLAQFQPVLRDSGKLLGTVRDSATSMLWDVAYRQFDSRDAGLSHQLIERHYAFDRLLHILVPPPPSSNSVTWSPKVHTPAAFFTAYLAALDRDALSCTTPTRSPASLFSLTYNLHVECPTCKTACNVQTVNALTMEIVGVTSKNSVDDVFNISTAIQNTFAEKIKKEIHSNPDGERCFAMRKHTFQHLQLPKYLAVEIKDASVLAADRNESQNRRRLTVQYGVSVPFENVKLFPVASVLFQRANPAKYFTRIFVNGVYVDFGLDGRPATPFDPRNDNGLGGVETLVVYEVIRE